MKNQYIRELAEGARVDALFALGVKEMRSTRAGEAFLALELADRSGRIPAVYFRPTSEAAGVPSGGVVRVRGVVSSYRGSKRISVEYLAPAAEYDPADLMESSRREKDEVVAEFKAVASTVRHRGLRRLLKAVFGDKGFFDRFVSCPGARTHHHAYLGGLMEHTLAVAALCRMLGQTYDGVDTDLLVTAALLHDIGKVDELTYDTAVGYTDEGRLLGHVVLSERRLREVAASLTPAPPRELLTRLSHAVLSHHGELEWGSPKRPSTIEALLLHHADNLDAKADGFISLTGNASRAEERWTDSSNLFRRPLYAPAPAADDRPVADSEEARHLVRA
ncbi:MAG: HD domain-containing protein [Anaerosomatales bacterium]|nr:HD domain-containing protein [Anaerosomatales bacterium]MDT8434069.1 HD domain-containing protein [Anaerosomatales bacterium]